MTEAMLPDCPACPDLPCEWRDLGPFIDRSGKLGEVSVEQCRHCGHGRSLPQLVDVAFLYEGRASQDYQPGNRGLSHAIKQVAFRRDARRLIRQIGVPVGDLLDFGCGSGQFTRELGNLLKHGQVTGADFFADPPLELEGCPYVPMADLAARAGTFDTAIAMHVLEHDDAAAALLKRIVALVRQGGTVVIEVPNIACFGARLFGRYWDAWYLPFHRSHFSRASLVALLEAGGLEICEIHSSVVPTMGRTFANLLGRENSLPLLLAGIAAHPVQLLGEWLTGEPSALRVVTRKR